MKLLKTISNIARALTLQKIGSKASSDINAAATRLSNINIKSSSDVLVQCPNIENAVIELSRAVQNAKVSCGIDNETLTLLTDFEVLLKDLSNDINESIRVIAEVARAAGHDFKEGMCDVGTKAALLANDGVIQALNRLDKMADSYCYRFDNWNDKVCMSFTKGLKEHGKDAAITLKEGIVLFNHTVVAVLIGVMFLFPPSPDLQQDWRWILFVAAFGCVALSLSKSELPKSSIIRGIAKTIGSDVDKQASSSSQDVVNLSQILHRINNLETNVLPDVEHRYEERLKTLETRHQDSVFELRALKTESDATRENLESIDTKRRTTANMLMLLSNPRPIFSQLDNSAFTASSHYNGPQYLPHFSRIHKTNLHGFEFNDTCWHQLPNTTQNYLQVDLRKPYYITEIQIRGRHVANQFLRKYRIGYTHPTMNVEVTLMNLAGGTEFDGCYNGTSVYSNKYFKPFVARHVKMYIVEFSGSQCCNWEILGVAMSDIDECLDGHVNHIDALRLQSAS